MQSTNVITLKLETIDALRSPVICFVQLQPQLQLLGTIDRPCEALALKLLLFFCAVDGPGLGSRCACAQPAQ